MSNLPVIRVLARDVSDKIAAGEVVERPLSIVKELVENSIDAGAGIITVEIKKGGKEYIRVTDNGCGIPREQVGLAFERYATSKIVTDDDLEHIQTLGFRGEALASIASVSQTEMLTKTAESRVGTRMVISASQVESIEDYACEDGTTIVIRDLFFNIPARRKFMKPDNSEASLVTDYVSRMALAYPDIRMRLISNGNILFATPGRGDLRNTIATVYDPALAKNLLDLDAAADDADMSVCGCVSKPSESKTSRRQQIFFVNGRWVKSKLMESALDEAYKDKLFEGRFPSAFIFLNVPAESLDVNIHPNKTDIRFYDEERVRNFLVNAVRSTLRSLDAAPSVADLMVSKNVPQVYESAPAPTEDSKPVSAAEKEEQYDAFFSELRSKQVRNEVPSTVSVIAPTSEAKECKTLFTDTGAEKTRGEQLTVDIIVKADTPEREFFFTSLDIVGQVFATYIIAKDEENMYIVDQHAAHERILYEKLISDFNNETASSQMLLIPQVINIPASLKLEAEERFEMLRGLGYAIEEFGPGEVVVKEVPSSMSLEEAEDFLTSVIEAESLNRYSAQQKRDHLITRACKSAIKANDHMSMEEIKALFSGLDACENPYSCPHGRPSFIKISEYETERMFKRK